MSSPLVSAIVLNYRSPQMTVECVQSLLRQSIADQSEVIVIDNHSQDDSIGVLRNRLSGMPSVRIVETSDNIGYGKGNNAGVSFAKGEFILITNPDNELEPDGLEKMIHTMQADDSIGILAPQLVFHDGSIRDSYRTFPSFLDVIAKRTFLRSIFARSVSRYLRSDEDPSTVTDTDWVVGACFLIRRSLFEELEGFDPRFFLFFEDTDLCRRCRQAGKRVVYFPSVRATDRKKRLSEGGVLSLVLKPAGRAHVASAFKYFWKWRN